MHAQTAAFYKESGHGETAWHSDLNTAPFDTNSMVTFWIALTDVPGVCVCMHVCHVMYVCMYERVCMYVYMYVCMYVAQ